MTTGSHVEGRLDDWLDDRLSPAERAEVDEHLLECEECRALRDGLLVTRRVLRASEAPTAPTGGLERKIRLALDQEDQENRDSETRGAPRPSGGRRTLWLPVAAGVVLAIVGLVIWLARSAPSPVDDAFAGYAALDTDPNAIAALATSDADELQRRWQEARLSFEARVLDLGAMGLELAGGRATRLGDHRAAFAVYTSETAAPVACWMFLGSEEALPAAVEEHEERGFHFRVYERDGITLVVWREGEVLCALASRGPSSDVLALAVAKAMAPRAA